MTVIKPLDLVEKHSYDVVISDYHMPDKDGLAFLKELKKRGSTVPFIMLTNDGNGELEMEAFNLGAEYFMQKRGNPVTVFAELYQAILELLVKKTSEPHGARIFHVPLEKTGCRPLDKG